MLVREYIRIVLKPLINKKVQYLLFCLRGVHSTDSYVSIVYVLNVKVRSNYRYCDTITDTI